MKITECYLYNFGRFKNFKLTLKDGLNCISAGNGYGKTTIAAFIRVMLFGMRDTKRSSPLENDRRRYLPWSGERCSGTLTFFHRGEGYRIERSFGTKVSEDTYKIYSLSTGKEPDEIIESPGEWALGVDDETFERTLFISERNTTVSSDSRGISERLSGADSISTGVIDSALLVLDEERKTYMKRGGGGEITDLKSEIAALDSEIRDTEEKKRELAATSQRLKEITVKISDTERSLEYCRSDYDRVRLTEIRNTFGRTDKQLRESIDRDRERLRKIDESFRGRLPSLSEVEECASYLRKSSSPLSEDKKELEDFFGRRKTTLSEIEEMSRIAEAEESKRTDQKKEKVRSRKGFATTAGIGIFIMLLGGIGAFAFSSYLWLLCALGVIITVTSFFKGRGIGARDTDTEGDVARLDAFLADFPLPTSKSRKDACLTVLDKYMRLYSTSDSNLGADSGRKRETVAAFIKEYACDTEDKLERMRELILEYHYLTDAVKRKTEELSSLKESFDKSGAYAYRTDQSVEDVLKREGDLKRTLSALEEERRLLKSRIELYEGEVERLDGLVSERAMKEDRLKKCEEKLGVILKTKELLTETAELMAAGHLGGTTDAFVSYYAAIDGERSEGLYLNTSFEASRTEYGSSHPAEAYSKGTRDLYEFSVKLAVDDAMFPEEKPVLILDDPFVYLDDAKLDKAKRLLLSLSRERQIIYFTASKSRGM